MVGALRFARPTHWIAGIAFVDLLSFRLFQRYDPWRFCHDEHFNEADNRESEMQGNDLAGKWRYRSFRNTLAPVGGDKDKALALIFAEAEFTFKIAGTKLTGIIDWGSGGLDLEGTVSQAGAEAPLSVAIRGLGRPGTDTQGWEYDYNASVAHK